MFKQSVGHIYHGILLINKTNEGLPQWSVVKNPPSNAGEAGSIPGRGTKIPHTVGQLSPCTTTTELTRLS